MNEESNKIDAYLEDSFNLAKKQKSLSNAILEVFKASISSIDNYGKLIFMGNGGSASDSNHLATELVGRFNQDREALPAISLTANNSIITAIANDYGYENIFSRQIEAVANSNDILFGLSTSGKSENIIKGFVEAKEKGITTVGLLGEEVSKMEKFCDFIISVPSSVPSLIQQSHITIGQLLCLLIEDHYYNG